VEKRKPSHDLARFKLVAGDPNRLDMTTQATRDARALGLERPAICRIIQTMTRAMFYKSMTSYEDARRWQDVYHIPWNGLTIYLKFTDNVVTEFTVLSFKEK
jgi:motility quorum-sensing regulator/GCU-specific mRNA interferase toxin